MKSQALFVFKLVHMLNKYTSVHYCTGKVYRDIVHTLIKGRTSFYKIINMYTSTLIVYTVHIQDYMYYVYVH